MIALIDADIVAYRCAHSAEHDPLEIAKLRTDNMMQDIVEKTGTLLYKGFISGANNFRFEIYPAYKANRKDTPRPKHLSDIQEFLVTEWKCKVTDGIEADDALGINQTEDTIICSIDKDLRQIPGKHYNIVTGVSDVIDEWHSQFNFYQQLILGDRSDNIMGYDGKARTTIPKFLQPWIDELYACETEYQMFSHVKGMYDMSENPHMDITGQILYIQRKENDKWDYERLKNLMQNETCNSCGVPESLE